MVNLAYEVEALGDRETFNKVVNYAKTVIEVIGEVEGNYNIADVLNDLIEQERIKNSYVNPIVCSLLLDKYGYGAESYNLTHNVTDFTSIAGEIARWKAVDLMIVYFHPELGVTVINPKRIESFKAVQNFKKNELVTIYAGAIKGSVSDDVKSLAIDKCIDLLSLEKIKGPAQLLKGAIKPRERRMQAKPPVKEKAAAPRRKAGKKTPAAPAKAKAPAAAPAAEQQGQKRMTPFYSIPVTNELFHNGNVEAWKKIIESYQTKYPGTDVYIFYEGERIHDINTLFKWGKVKHGSVILIAAAGNNIKDVAKLQKYLRQGASPMFEAFLKFPVNHVLNLF
ncbi:MAG: hypothetical protein JXD23_12130 [Spirochaetales bacterium]|nr:hypothetical protein [Spirochaetales bacterium]